MLWVLTCLFIFTVPSKVKFSRVWWGFYMDEQLIRDELQRVLKSNIFTRSNRLRNFLSYIVESTLDETSPVLSEIIIAQDVFGKTETFDPKKDAAIRVSANRLRKSLKAYYQKQGTKNPLRISIPVGAYTPVFQTQPISKTPSNFVKDQSSYFAWRHGRYVHFCKHLAFFLSYKLRKPCAIQKFN